MPTIIAMDVSLSMQRTIPGRSETYHQLALKGISQFIDYLISSSSKLEYISLITFSTFSEVKVDFTRDYDQVRQAVRKVETGDKLCLESMLKSVSGILSTNWGTQNYCQVVVFTDCGLGFGSTALKGFIQGYVGKEQDPEKSWIASLKAVKLNFVCMGLHSDYYFTRAIPLYQQLLDLTGLKGQLYMTKPHKDPAALDCAENSTDNAVSKNASSNSSTLASANSISSGSAAGGSGHLSHKSELGRTAMFELIERMCEANFKPYEATLKCGGYFRLECPILIWPPPAVPYHSESGGVKTQHTISPKLEVCGYLALSEIGSPASLSRHLIIPKVDREKPTRRGSDKSGSASKSASSNSASGNVKAAAPLALDVNQPNYEYEKLEQDIRDFYTKEAKDTDESGEDGDTNTGGKSASSAPTEMQKESMCVLLHGALKVENLAALVLLNDANWYGFLYSYSDSKKKSNLMLNILPPGSSVIPWLGDLQMLSFSEDLMPGETSAFPVKADKRSYSQSCVVWIRHVSLQSDIQKVLRHAKKMPEKTQHFYKELNRIRRAALSFGFVELLEAMATLFEKESALSSNPECSFQLKHAAVELRKPSNHDLKVVIVPVQKFGVAENATSSMFAY